MFANQNYFRPSMALTRSPIYLGRRESLSKTGDYFVPPWSPGIAVVLSESGPRAIVNVCRHRQALLLSGRGNSQRIRCPMHGWCWNLEGRTLGCPGFDEGADLQTISLVEHGGWMFAPDPGFAGAVDTCRHLQLEGYTLAESNRYPYACSWIEYIDVFLDVNHIKFIHPGLRTWVDSSRVEVQLGEGWSVHSVPLKPGERATGLTQAWWRALTSRVPDALPAWVHWTHVFPNVLIENYGGYFIGVAVVVPDGEHCVVHEEVWVRSDLADDTALVGAFSAMFAEIEREDAELLMATRRGREALTALGLEDAGPYQNPSEAGMEHFHRWLTKQL